LANGSTGGSNNALLYGIIGALCVVVIGGGAYMFKTADKPVEPTVQAAKPALPPPPPPPPPQAAAPKPAPPPAPAAPAGPSAAQIGQARPLIADARRFASAGDFSRAETALENAEKVAPGFAEVSQARRDIAALHTNQSQLASLVERTRRAIDRQDFATAERSLAEAERIDANAADVVELRRQLRAAERQDRQQDNKVAVLLASARAAISTGDLGAADRAIFQAEQIDPRDPKVIQARADFHAAERSRRLPRN